MDEAVPLFAVRGLSKTFPSGFTALCSIDLDIFEGECLFIAGSNGSGKTLLMRILAGLMDASSGEIRFRGKPLAAWGGGLRRSIGMVFQDADAQILGETVYEDIRFGPENQKLPPGEIEKRVSESLAMLGLETKKDFPPRRLSGGEKRRLAVAGILAMGCDTVVFDEPFANLDWPGVIQVLRILRDLKAENRTVIVLTHELEKALAFADRLVILDKGRIRAAGLPGEILDALDPRWGVRDPRRNYQKAADCSWLDDESP
ncbi:MAG: energy-coupling factor ABC transporter ATP-binding protein [Treponema sp.]|jgi:biotin transport system ATP-binding protein|nr:energy-coupling factor ABC transporter ATP-binding protein [Treponema sp.]